MWADTTITLKAAAGREKNESAPLSHGEDKQRQSMYFGRTICMRHCVRHQVKKTTSPKLPNNKKILNYCNGMKTATQKSIALELQGGQAKPKNT